MFFNRETYRKNAYAALRDAVNARFATHLLASGFILFHKAQGSALYHSYHRQSHFGYDFVSIQFDKYARPKFVINLARIPAEGLDVFGRHINADTALEGDVCFDRGLRGRLYRRLRSHFRLDRLQWYAIAYSRAEDFSKSSERLVADLMQDFQEAERWFAGEALTNPKHLHIT